MSSGTPYIGSKISLISKAEIRYEGVLYDVDSKEATVTLSKVKSYGTENRQAPKQIPPRNDVYEYIIFRGSDIKDLSVSEMGNKEEEPHLDPAIVSAQAAPSPSVGSSRSDPTLSSHPGGPPSSSGSSILPTPNIPPHPVPPGGGGGYSQFPPGLGGYNPFGMPPYFSRPPMMMGPPHHHPMHPPPPPSNQSHPQTPPTHISTISSGNQNSTVTPFKTTTTQSSVISATQSEVAPPVTTALSSAVTPTLINSGFTSQVKMSSSAPSHQPHPNKATAMKPPSRDTTESQLVSIVAATPQNSIKQDGGTFDAKSKKHSASSSPSSINDDPETANRRQTKRAYSGRKDGQQKPFNYTPRGPRVVNSWRGGGGRGGGTPRPPRGGSGGYQSSNRPPPPSTQQDSQPLKYTKEFDFESANALFSKDQLEEEMKSKLKITTDDQQKLESSEQPCPNEEEEMEEGELEKDKDDGENGNSEAKTEDFYDKSKSFFDTISCESNQPNSNRRPNRGEEMALNTETFGVTNRGYSSRPKGNRGYNSRYRGGGGSGRGYYNQYNGYNQYHRGRGGGGEGSGTGRYRGGHYGGRGRYTNRNYGGYSDYQGRGGRDS